MPTPPPTQVAHAGAGAAHAAVSTISQRQSALAEINKLVADFFTEHEATARKLLTKEYYHSSWLKQTDFTLPLDMYAVAESLPDMPMALVDAIALVHLANLDVPALKTLQSNIGTLATAVELESTGEPGTSVELAEQLAVLLEALQSFKLSFYELLSKLTGPYVLSSKFESFREVFPAFTEHLVFTLELPFKHKVASLDYEDLPATAFQHYFALNLIAGYVRHCSRYQWNDERCLEKICEGARRFVLPLKTFAQLNLFFELCEHMNKLPMTGMSEASIEQLRRCRTCFGFFLEEKIHSLLSLDVGQPVVSSDDIIGDAQSMFLKALAVLLNEWPTPVTGATHPVVMVATGVLDSEDLNPGLSVTYQIGESVAKVGEAASGAGAQPVGLASAALTTTPLSTLQERIDGFGELRDSFRTFLSSRLGATPLLAVKKRLSQRLLGSHFDPRGLSVLYSQSSQWPAVPPSTLDLIAEQWLNKMPSKIVSSIVQEATKSKALDQSDYPKQAVAALQTKFRSLRELVGGKKARFRLNVAFSHLRQYLYNYETMRDSYKTVKAQMMPPQAEQFVWTEFLKLVRQWMAEKLSKLPLVTEGQIAILFEILNYFPESSSQQSLRDLLEHPEWVEDALRLKETLLGLQAGAAQQGMTTQEMTGFEKLPQLVEAVEPYIKKTLSVSVKYRLSWDRTKLSSELEAILKEIISECPDSYPQKGHPLVLFARNLLMRPACREEKVTVEELDGLSTVAVHGFRPRERVPRS